MAALQKLLDRIYQLAGLLSALCIILMFVGILAQILARQFAMHIPSSSDIVGYCVAWSAFLGLAYAMHHQAHIRVELVTSRLSKTWQRGLNICVGAFATLLLGAVSYYVLDLVLESFSYGDVTDGEVPLPLGMVELPMCVGLVLFTVSMLDYTLSCAFCPPRVQKDGLIGDGS